MGAIPNHIAVGGGYRKGRIPPTCMKGEMMDTISLLAEIEILKERLAHSVEVVKCGECKYREKNHYCVKWGQPYLCKDECFCSYGERKE